MAGHKKTPTPPRDIIGDVEGCYEELLELIEKLGYTLVLSSDPLPRVLYAKGRGKRKLVFVGDIVNRGPRPDLVVNLIMQLVEMGLAFAVLGNQEKKYLKYLDRRPPRVGSEVRRTIDTVAQHGLHFQQRVRQFLLDRPLKYETDRLIVVHGAYREAVEPKVFERLAVWGETDGTVDKRGLPIRLDKWETDYQGTKTIVHGHIARREVSRRDLPTGGRIINVDTRCAFGGKLTALRFPTLEFVQVPAKAVYVQPWD